MARRSYFTWLGEKIQARVEKAAMRAVDRTTEKAAAHARSNHKGWVSRTGTAEGSIGTNKARKLKRVIRGNVTGGAGEAFHLLILEFRNGSALRNAADVEFPHVQSRLAEEYGRG